MPRLTKGTPVCVVWEDANGEDSGWVDVNEITHQAKTIRTVGVLLNQNAECVTVALSTHEDGTIVAGYIVIPKPFITSIRGLS